jgi:hypothetical protein
MNLIAFLLILIQVESGGDNMVIGAAGERGCLQISESVILDVNRVYGTYYVHLDAHDRQKSMDIAVAYLNHYVTEKRLGRKPTWEDYARIWNGGPNGHKKEATKPYWEKVKIRMSAMK